MHGDQLRYRNINLSGVKCVGQVLDRNSYSIKAKGGVSHNCSSDVVTKGPKSVDFELIEGRKVFILVP